MTAIMTLRELKFLAAGLIVGFAAGAIGTSPARAETMTFERVVPANSTLTYAENGSVIRVLPVPPGRVHVTVTYGGPITPRHRRQASERQE